MFGSNPNTMTFKTVFLAEYQMSHFKQPVYQVLADTRLESDLTKGQTVARSYASDVVVNDMGADGSYVTQAITDTQETLVINKEKEASIYVKDLDDLQAHLPVKQKYGRKLANAMINQIDADTLGTAYAGAGSTLDDGDLGGTATNGLTASASNIATVFTLAMQKMMLKNVVYNANARFSAMKLEQPEGMPIAIVSPEILTYIQLYLGGKDSMLGDTVSRNGYRGSFMGFEVFVSNALAWTGELALSVNPTDGDTIVINGVTLTFKSTVDAGVTAGQVKIATTAALTVTNLTAFLNAGCATTVADAANAGYNAVSAANQAKLKNMTAVDGTTKVTVTTYGKGTVVVSSTFTSASNIWTLVKQKLHCLFGLSKSISLVVQKNPSLTSRPSPQARIGEDQIVWAAYGLKVFQDQAPQLVDCAVNSSAFAAPSNVQR